MFLLRNPNLEVPGSGWIDTLHLRVAADQYTLGDGRPVGGPERMAKRLLRWACLHEQGTGGTVSAVEVALRTGNLTVRAARIPSDPSEPVPDNAPPLDDRAFVKGYLQAGPTGLMVAGWYKTFSHPQRPMLGVVFVAGDGPVRPALQYQHWQMSYSHCNQQAGTIEYRDVTELPVYAAPVENEQNCTSLFAAAGHIHDTLGVFDSDDRGNALLQVDVSARL